MKIRHKTAVLTLIVASFLLLVSCNESWVDHYQTDGQVGDKTIWEVLSEQEELQSFVNVLKNAGYEKILNSDQKFTVWAPKDSINTMLISGSTMSADDVLIQIVNNHIARSSVSVSSLTIDTIQMLNGKEKALGLDSAGKNQFDEIPVKTKNIVCSNGILHIIDHQSPYDNNLWSQIRQDSALTNLSDYFYSFSVSEFDAENSTQSGVKNGKKVYSDSVFYTTNKMWSKLGYMNSDNYHYWLLAPTNEAWSSAITKYGTYFNYPIGTVAGLKETNTKQALSENLLFQTNRQRSAVDSLTSTTGCVFHDPFGADGLFSKITDTVKCSNGSIFKTSELLLKPELTFMKTMVAEAENTDYVLDKTNCATDDAAVMVTAAKIKVSNNKYMPFTPISSKLRPSVKFALPNTLSGTYDIGVVFVPLNLTRNGWTTTVDQMPGKVSLVLSDLNDKTANGYVEVATIDVSASKIDTIWVAKGHIFPTCDYFPENVPSKAKVSITVSSVVKPSQTATYTRKMYIDCIVVKPTIK